MGIVLTLEGRPDDAIEYLRKALAIKPDYADAHFNLAKILMDKDQLHEALACCMTAVSLNPSFIDAYIVMAQCMYKQNMVDAAISCYERAIAIKPDYSSAWGNLGTVFLGQGRLE